LGRRPALGGRLCIRNRVVNLCIGQVRTGNEDADTDGAGRAADVRRNAEPATTLTLDADAISQPNGGAQLLLAQFPKKDTVQGKKGGKKKSEEPEKD
jgi:hypothetical protein